MPIFLDTNILIYLFDEESEFHEWSKSKFVSSKEIGPVIISDIVYCEFSVALDSVESTDETLSELALERMGFSNEALFLAGKAFAEYKKNAGPKMNVLSDFLIGAQVVESNGKLVTVNTGDFVNYFPSIEIVSP